MKILGIVGSKNGYILIEALKVVLENINNTYPNIDTVIRRLGDYYLPYADGTQYDLPIIEEIIEADALIIGTPIYQASIPGILKNLFDLLPQDTFKDKIIGIVANGGSSMHYLVPEYQLKPILNYMNGHIIQKYVYIEGSKIDSYGDINDIQILERLKNLSSEIMEQLKRRYT